MQQAFDTTHSERVIVPRERFFGKDVVSPVALVLSTTPLELYLRILVTLLAVTKPWQICIPSSLTKLIAVLTVPCGRPSPLF